MDGSNGWMDGHTFSPTTLIQKHLASGAQFAKIKVQGNYKQSTIFEKTCCIFIIGEIGLEPV